MREAVRLTIASAVNLTDAVGVDASTVKLVAWENQVDAQRWAPAAWCDLRLTGVNGSGTDEIRWTYTAGATPALSTNLPTYCGYRTFSVWVKLCIDSQSPTEEAVTTLSGLLRTRLRRTDILAIAQAAGVALVRIGPTFEADYRDADGRMVSSSTTEIRFACVEQDVDSTSTGDFVNAVVDAEGTYTAGVSGSDIVTDVDVP